MGNDLIIWSVRTYRRLLQLYPPAFRSEFGGEMARVFADACRDRFRHRGPRGVAGMWLETVPDLVVSVVDEHAEEDFKMARTNLARGLALGGLVGGGLWIAFALLANLRSPGIINGPSRNLDDLGQLLLGAMIFLAAGLGGVYLRLAPRWPVSARLTLLLALAGNLWALLTSPLIDNYFFVFLAGVFALAGGLLLTGLVLWTQRGLQRDAALVAGIGACFLLFNTEDARVLFAAVAGILVIALSTRVFAGTLDRPGDPPLPA